MGPYSTHKYLDKLAASFPLAIDLHFTCIALLFSHVKIVVKMQNITSWP